MKLRPGEIKHDATLCTVCNHTKIWHFHEGSNGSGCIRCLEENPEGDICYCFEDIPGILSCSKHEMRMYPEYPSGRPQTSCPACEKEKEAPMKSEIKVDPVNNPSHYANKKIEVIDYMEDTSTHEEFCGHLRLTALKYLSRTGLKGTKDDALTDLKKGRWYLDRLITTLEKRKGK